jgi:hypothetical protein
VASPRVTGIGAGPLLLPTDGRNARMTVIAASTTDAAAEIARIAVAAVNIHKRGWLHCVVLDARYTYIGWVRKTPQFNYKDLLGPRPSMFTFDLTIRLDSYSVLLLDNILPSQVRDGFTLND